MDEALKRALLDALPDAARIGAVLAQASLDPGDLTAMRDRLTLLRTLYGLAGSWGQQGRESQDALHRAIQRIFWQAGQYWKSQSRCIPDGAAFSATYVRDWIRNYGWLSERALESLLARPGSRLSVSALRHMQAQHALGLITLEDVEAGV